MKICLTRMNGSSVQTIFEKNWSVFLILSFIIFSSLPSSVFAQSLQNQNISESVRIISLDQIPESSDTVVPIVSVPSYITASAPDRHGSQVTFLVTAIDEVDGSIIPKCSMESGSIFAIGITQVTCFAMDQAGNVGYASFFIKVVKGCNSD